MTLRGIIDVRVNASLGSQNNQMYSTGELGKMYLKYIFELFRFRVGFLKKAREMDVQESRNMTQVE